MRNTLSIVLLSASLVLGQEALNNDAVVKMVKAGLSEPLIVNMIKSQPGNYVITADTLVHLKQSGVPENVLNAMLARNSGVPAAPSTVVSVPSESPKGDIPADAEIGVYYKKAGKWQEMLPEVVNWKTGGVLKSVASAGLVKGDVNGHVPGEHSHNSGTSPIEVFIYAPEGVAITEYQLLRLRSHPDSREFRTVTGGMMHVSGGATRDIVQFEGTKVAPRMYRVLLSNLAAGEYGFLPPGAVTSATSASIGKIYTFQLLE